MSSSLPYLTLFCLLAHLSLPVQSSTLGPCKSNADCGAHQFCDLTQSTEGDCNCAFAYRITHVMQNGQKVFSCSPVKCDACASYFGASSRCIAPGSLCQCPAPGRKVEGFTVACLSPLGGACKEGIDCRENAACSAHAHTCTCPFGYLPDGAVNCKPATCSADADCQAHFGGQSHCRIPEFGQSASPFCACSDPVKFYESSSSAVCEKRVNANKKSCTGNNDCPEYSDCKNGVCGCWFQAVPIPDKDTGNCGIFPCINDAECARLWPGTRCNHEGSKFWNGICAK